MADYKMEISNKNDRKSKAVRYTYEDITNIQIVILLVLLAVMAFIVVAKFFFTNIAEMNLLRYIAYSCTPILIIAYIVKAIEKKDLKAYTYEDEEKNSYANMLFALEIMIFFSVVARIGILGLAIEALTGWKLIIKPVIEKYTVSKEECNQISFIFISTIVILTAMQVIPFVFL